MHGMIAGGHSTSAGGGDYSALPAQSLRQNDREENAQLSPLMRPCNESNGGTVQPAQQALEVTKSQLQAPSARGECGRTQGDTAGAAAPDHDEGRVLES
jgi:hypothetical protein